MNRYDEWNEIQLQTECTRRYLDNDGQMSKLAKRLADDDANKRQSRPIFTKLSDPTGMHEVAYETSRTKFEKNYWNSIFGSEIKFHESIVKVKKNELLKALKKEDASHKAAMKLKDARITGYKGVNQGTVEKISVSGGAAVDSTGAKDQSKNNDARDSKKDNRDLVQAVKPTEDAVVGIAVASRILIPENAKIPSKEKSTCTPTTTTLTTVPGAKSATNSAVDSGPPAKKKYEPMPVIESAFHKAPAPKAARKPRATPKNVDSEPVIEPKAPKKFMTAAGAAYLKSLEGDATTDYDTFIAPSATIKRRREEKTESSIAKKLRLAPEDVANPDLHPHLVESDFVQQDLIDIGYLFLPCEDEKKIRGDALAFLKHEYRAFAITEIRADQTGYFMVFEKTGKGDRDLKKCFELIDIEIEDGSFKDKNVTDVKISKRSDAVEDPELESDTEPPPMMKEVNLGYTPVPYKKPAPRRGGRR